MSVIETSSSSKPQTASPWWEIVLVMVLSLGITLFVPGLKAIGLVLPIVYLLADHYLRKRAWIESGFDLKNLPQALVRNVGWILLVGVGTQALAVFGTYYLLPDYSAHVLARLPIDVHSLGAAVIVSLLVSTLGEEIIYRGLFQKRLNAFLAAPLAIGLSSLVFALMHYAPGPALIVVVDLALILVDSLIYGLIFSRSNNVFASWTAHFLADVMGVVFLLMLSK